jgi:5'-nucleotidase / UDP-sugar diphosphatase
MRRRDALARLVLLGLAGMLCLARPAVGQPGIEQVERPARLDLTILHTNDIHGHMLPFAYTEEGRGKLERPSVGGAARRATLIKRLKASIRNPVMLVDAGDVFTRGPLTNAYEGVADVEVMNALGYELTVIGNNEFKAKDAIEATDAAGAQAALLRVIKRSRFPWICANTTDQKGAMLEGVAPYVVREIGGVRVGFLGLTAPRSATYPQTKGWTISDPIAAAKEWIPRVRAECDVLIALTHIGVDLDRELAAQTSGIDAIVGGDSHTFLYEATVVKNQKDVPVPIVQTGEFGVNLGRFDLHFERGVGGDWRLARYEYRLIPVGPSLREDPAVAAVASRYARPFQNVVGRTPVGATPEERARLTTQALVDALRAQTGSDLAVNPLGGGMFDAFQRPQVTRYDVYAAMPFKNTVVRARLTGDEVRALLLKPETKPVVAGDVTRLDPARTYSVALVDFVARSTYALPNERLEETGRDIREVVIEHLQRTARARAVRPPAARYGPLLPSEVMAAP